MSVNLRFPNINGKSDAERLTQVQSYLYQLVQQLNWALDNVGGSALARQSVKLSKASGGIVESAEAQSAFNDIKSLIIKSADIVNAYYDSINARLKGIYVSQSDFGTYSEETDAVINANSTNIEQIYSNIQNILTDIDTLEHSQIEANAYINSGLLYTDEQGIPVYGLEVGQRTEIDGQEVFNKFARFTSDRLSFYDQNGTEVAYISDKKLYITQVEITGSEIMGGFIRLVQPDKTVVKKWVG